MPPPDSHGKRCAWLRLPWRSSVPNEHRWGLRIIFLWLTFSSFLFLVLIDKRMLWGFLWFDFFFFFDVNLDTSCEVLEWTCKLFFLEGMCKEAAVLLCMCVTNSGCYTSDFYKLCNSMDNLTLSMVIVRQDGIHAHCPSVMTSLLHLC